MKVIPIDKPGAPVPASNNPVAPITNNMGNPLIAQRWKQHPVGHPELGCYVTTYTDPRVPQYEESLRNLENEVARLRGEAAAAAAAAAAAVRIPKPDNFSGTYEMASDSGTPKMVSPQFNLPHQWRNWVSYKNAAILREFLPLHPSEAWNREIVRFLMVPLMPKLDDLEFERIYDSPGEVKDRMAGIIQTGKALWRVVLAVCCGVNEKNRSEYRDLVARLSPDNTTLAANNDDCVIFNYTGTLCDNAVILYGLEGKYQERPILLLLARINFIAELLYQHPYVQDLPPQRVIAFMNAIRSCKENGDVEAMAGTFIRDAMNEWRSQKATPPQTAFTPSPEMMGILRFLSRNPEGLSGKVLMDHAEYSSKSKFHKTVLDVLLDKGLLGLAIKDKPSSPQQKYLLTEAGGAVLRQFGTVPVSIIPCGTAPASVPTVPSTESGCSI